MNGDSPTARTPRLAEEVFHDHLRESLDGSIETDLARNYADDVVVLTSDGVHRGHSALRRLARRLEQELPHARFAYRTKLVSGEVAFLEWTAESEGAIVEDGADSYVIRDGRIRAQTIHYTVKVIA